MKPLPPNTIAALSPPPAAYPYTFFENVRNHAFRPTEQTMQLVNAWWLMDAAFLAYSPTADILRIFAAALGATVETFGHAGTEAYVAATDEWVVLAFRGTQVDHFWASVIDWAVNVRILPVPDDRGHFAHEGFLTATRLAWPAIAMYLRNLQRTRRRPLWITGHSLGAALATVAASFCCAEPRQLGLSGVYTY